MNFHLTFTYIPQWVTFCILPFSSSLPAHNRTFLKVQIMTLTLLLCQLLSYYCLSTPKLPSILSDAVSVAIFWLCQQLAVGIHQ